MGLRAQGVYRGEAETVEAERVEGGRTNNLKTSFDICVRRTRCEQD